MNHSKNRGSKLAALVVGGALLLTAAAACAPTADGAPGAVDRSATTTSNITDPRYQELVAVADSLGLRLADGSFDGQSEQMAISLISGLDKLDVHTLLDGRQPLGACAPSRDPGDQHSPCAWGLRRSRE